MGVWTLKLKLSLDFKCAYWQGSLGYTKIFLDPSKCEIFHDPNQETWKTNSKSLEKNEHDIYWYNI